jgi:hypothetical protein
MMTSLLVAVLVVQGVVPPETVPRQAPAPAPPVIEQRPTDPAPAAGDPTTDTPAVDPYVEAVTVRGRAAEVPEPGVAARRVMDATMLQAVRGVLADDPVRVVQTLPEVAAGDDFNAQFAVRGHGPTHLGLAIDGVDSPLLFHTVRGVNDTGSLAFINTDVLGGAALMAGAYPQRAGAYLGARVDFTTRDGARDRLRGRALFSASGVTAVAEGPLGRVRDGQPARASWLVAARKSYLGWLLGQVDPSRTERFGFVDGTAILSADLSPKHSLRLLAISGDAALDDRISNPGLNSLVRALNQSGVLSAQWRYAPGRRGVFTQQLYVVAARYQNRVPDGRTREDGSDRDVTLRSTLQLAITGTQGVEVGAQQQWLRADRLDRSFSSRGETITLDRAGAWEASGAWAYYRWQPHRTLQWTTGLRADRSSLTGASAVSPVVLAEWSPSASWRVRGGLGRQHQLARFDDTWPLPASGAQPRAERAASADAGIEWRSPAHWRLQVDGYVRHDRDRLRLEQSEYRRVGTALVAPRQPFRINAMTGRARGVTSTLTYSRTTILLALVSYTLAEATLSDLTTGESFPSDFDQRHTVNTSLRVQPGRGLGFTSRIRYGSNFPIVGYLDAVSADLWRIGTRRNQSRLPAYSRVDVRADWTPAWRGKHVTVFAEVINALGRRNLGPQSYSVRLPAGTVTGATERLFPVVPSAGVLVQF